MLEPAWVNVAWRMEKRRRRDGWQLLLNSVSIHSCRAFKKHCLGLEEGPIDKFALPIFFGVV